MLTDPIADYLTRIRNANTALHETTEVPASGSKKALTRILKEEGYIRGFEVMGDGKQGRIRIYLKYGKGKERVITGLKRISKPGLRVYVRKDEVPRVLGGLGVAILSTSKGMMTDKEARNQSIGGEVVCYIW
jgi:small subunit ribosomal protein S8